jgi:hypothetical protein
VFQPDLVMLHPPPDHVTLEVHIGPTKLPYGPDAVPGLVGQDQRQLEAWCHLICDVQQDFVEGQPHLEPPDTSHTASTSARRRSGDTRSPPPGGGFLLAPLKLALQVRNCGPNELRQIGFVAGMHRTPRKDPAFILYLPVTRRAPNHGAGCAWRTEPQGEAVRTKPPDVPHHRDILRAGYGEV